MIVTKKPDTLLCYMHLFKYFMPDSKKGQARLNVNSFYS